MSNLIYYRWGGKSLNRCAATLLLLITVLPLSAQITFDPEQIINPVADNARSVFVIDLDGDGDKDVLSASQDDDRISWYENDGNQIFTQYNLTTTLDLACGVVGGDLDGDGDMDIAACSFTTNTGKICWFQNDGAQNFTQIDIEINVNKAHGVIIEDIENDGDLDLLVTVRNDDKITLYTNNGSGVFVGSDVVNSTALCNSPRTCWAADVDGDGDTDILHQSMLSNAVYWNENDGAQNFTTHLISSGTLADCKFVSAGDLDGDGDMDVLTASRGSDRISWFENDGSQNFTENLISSTNVDPFCVYPVDVDGDGDLDIFTAINGQSHFAWYANDGTGSFGPKQIISGASTCAGAIFIMPSDLDGDGDWDAVVAANSDDDVSWFEMTFGVLPVELLSFDGAQKETHVDLFWTTATEINNDYFQVERSLDGVNFEALGQVKGFGNSTAILNYSFIDNNPFIGVNYYRLKQVDFNGDHEYSSTVAFNFKHENQTVVANIYPNPTQHSINLRYDINHDNTCIISIYDAVGKLVAQQTETGTEGSNQANISLADLSDGVYTLRLNVAEEQVSQLRFVKH